MAKKRFTAAHRLLLSQDYFCALNSHFPIWAKPQQIKAATVEDALSWALSETGPSIRAEILEIRFSRNFYKPVNLAPCFSSLLHFVYICKRHHILNTQRWDCRYTPHFIAPNTRSNQNKSIFRLVNIVNSVTVPHFPAVASLSSTPRPPFSIYS